jgi:multicopper oxidase
MDNGVVMTGSPLDRVYLSRRAIVAATIVGEFALAGCGRSTSPQPALDTRTAAAEAARPHTGLDADYGRYLPVIVDDPADPGRYDAEGIVVLDDWTDGIGKSPQELYDDLRGVGKPVRDNMPGMSGMAGVGSSALLGGTPATSAIRTTSSTAASRRPQQLSPPSPRSGSGSSTPAPTRRFPRRLAGHTMTVTHTDGYAVQPTQVDALLMGMCERYDVIVTAGDGIFPLVALAERQNTLARAVLSTDSGTAPDPGFQPSEVNGRVGTVDMFTATPAVDLGSAKPDTSLSADLSGGMAKYDWKINGRAYPDTQPLTIRQGQRATLTFNNTTTMWHRMHLHGHTFQVTKPDGSPGPRKDTAIVLPMQKVAVNLIADNPGVWMLHCHKTYHQEAGMMTSLNYAT